MNDFETLLASRPPPEFDYLFSVINGVVLSRDVLELPRRAAINYHNGPLPRYAGVHAASWALLNRETVHGVTWHRMVDRVDAGPVYKQRLFPMAATATAAEVNDTCRRLGLEALGELMTELATDRARPVPQDLTHRTYYPAHRKHASGGLVSWDSDAQTIVRLVNAHQIGRVLNTFGTARADLGGDVALVGAARATGVRSTARPGAVVAAADGGLRVATPTEDVELTGLSRQDGSTIALPAPGVVLPEVTSALRTALAAFLESASPHEPFCSRALAAADRTPLPVSAPAPPAPPAGARTSIPVALPVLPVPDPDEGPPRNALNTPDARAAEPVGAAQTQGGRGAAGLLHRLVLAATVLTVWEHTGRDRVTVDQQLPGADGCAPPLMRFARVGLPVTVPVGRRDPGAAVREVWERTGEEAARCAGRDAYSRDLAVRRKLPRAGIPVCVGTQTGSPTAGDAQLGVFLEAGRQELHLTSAAGHGWPVLPDAELAALGERVRHWLRLCLDHADAHAPTEARPQTRTRRVRAG